MDLLKIVTEFKKCSFFPEAKEKHVNFFFQTNTHTKTPHFLKGTNKYTPW